MRTGGTGVVEIWAPGSSPILRERLMHEFVTHARPRRSVARLAAALAFGMLATAVPSSTLGAASPARGNARSPIGYNLDFPGDWTLLRPFIDLMHNARPWAGACADADPRCDHYAHLTLDAQGWPKTLQYRDMPTQSYGHLETVFSTIVGGPEVGKVFVVTWEGTGELEIFGGELLASVPAQRRLTFKFRGGNTILRILRTDPERKGDHVRNVRVFRQDFESLLAKDEIFNPDMLAYLAPFGSLRFMDWMLSNDPEEREARWSERPRPDLFPWVRQPIDLGAPCDTSEKPACRRIGGYPVEVMVALANRLGADPHFNMPYRADNDWITGFATYVRDHLDRNLRPTVEYSNEVWNWGFPQAGYAKQEGAKLGILDSTAWLQFMGVRAAKVCKLWKKVFAGQPDRVRCVIAPQTGWTEVANASLDCPGWVAHDPSSVRPCHEGVDAVAITGYFGGDLLTRANDPVLRAWLAKGKDFARDRAFRYLEQGEGKELLDEEGKPLGDRRGGSAVTTIELFKRWKTIAAERHMALYVYEGGTGFGRPDGDLRAFLAGLTTDPRMFGLYRRVLDEYRKAGGTAWNAWGNLGAGDAWSNGESLLDRGSPKYRALLDFAKANPCGWPGCDRSAR
jgi:hypothetical protein